MTLVKRYVFAVIPMFSEATALFCLLILFGGISTGEDVFISFHVYITCLLLCALINALIFRRERPLLIVIVLNALAVSLTTAFVLLSPSTILGVFMYIYVCFMCIYPTVRCAFYLCFPITPERMMTHCDMSVLGTALLLVSQGMGLAFDYIILCFIVIALNLLALSSLRIMRSRQAGELLPGMQRGFILVGAGAGLFMAAIFIGSLLLPALRDTIASVLKAILHFITAFFSFIYQVITFLMQKLPIGSIEPPSTMDEPADAPADFEVDDLVGLPAVFYALILLFVLALVISLARWLYKNRKLRLSGIDLSSGLKKEKSLTPSLFSIILALVRRLYEKAVFFLRFLMNYNTVAGVFVRIEYLENRYGQPRCKGEPPREFLMRVCTPEALPEFLDFANEIDRMCFSPNPVPNRHMDRPAIDALLAGLKPRSE